MCAAELTWYTWKVYNWILMKHAWWNWHAVPGTAYWNMGHTAGTLRKIGIYLLLRNNRHIDVPWNISKIFYWIFFFCSTHGFDIELYDILYSILCKLYILRAQYPASASMKLRIFQVIFLTDTGFCSEILKYTLMTCLTKFSGVISNDRSDVYAKVQGQRSTIKVTEVKNPD